MTTLAAVVRETRAGRRPARVAARLGMSVGAVEAALDHAESLGLVVRPTGGCTDCAATTDARPPGCAGCPFAR